MVKHIVNYKTAKFLIEETVLYRGTIYTYIKWIPAILYYLISKLFMPPDSINRFLIAPIRAIRSFRRHLYLISCQEPIRRLLRLLRPPGAPKPSGPSGLLKQVYTSKSVKESSASIKIHYVAKTYTRWALRRSTHTCRVLNIKLL